MIIIVNWRPGDSCAPRDHAVGHARGAKPRAALDLREHQSTPSRSNSWPHPAVSTTSSHSRSAAASSSHAGEIYGGTRSAWDYGPLGVELKENIKRQWWRTMVTSRDDIVGLDSAVILPRQVWVASGHVGVFTDPLTECLSCHKRYREDQMLEEFEEKKGRAPVGGLAEIACANCGTRGQWTEPRDFNMMLKTYLGPVEDESGLHYLRPETAQGIFVNFANVVGTSRMKPPFGIGQIGKSFRNEITPGNFIFRTREFEQMEMEFFVVPGTDEEWHQYWIDARTDWYTGLGISRDNLRHFEHPKEKLSHYSKRTVDIEYRFGFQGSEWGELEGIANRTDFDLNTHSENSGKDLQYRDPVTNEKYTPYVIEPAAGLTRSLMAFLVESYEEDEAPNTTGGVDKRTVLRLDHDWPPSRPRCCHSASPTPCSPPPRTSPRSCAGSGTSTTTSRKRSASATAVRTRSARRTASRSTSRRSTTRR